MIDPKNPKLKKFHLLVSLTLYMDFLMTSFIVGNYNFQIGKDPRFLSHEKIFAYIIII